MLPQFPPDALAKHCSTMREVRLQPMRVTLPIGLLVEDGEALSAEAPAGDLRCCSAFRLLKCPAVKEGQYVKVSEILQDSEVVVAYGIAQRDKFWGMIALKVIRADVRIGDGSEPK